ncbi:hypothetical protein [Chryseobacterium sp. MMS23-Vi53]|uniref:hypothetical protein n=1 Tax=Chryseobacterium sp. MMS23-Vi53 TaxID=3386644 RepID=UPI0039EBD493
MKNKFIFLFVLSIFGNSFAQVGIGNADPKVMLDVRSTTGNSAIAFGDTNQTAADAGPGAVKYSDGLFYSNGVTWVRTVASSPNGFVPKVVAAGKKTTPQTFSTAENDTRVWDFQNITVNDGNWDIVNNAYKVPVSGLYQVSLGGAIGANATSNAQNWDVFVYTGATEERSVMYSISNLAPNNTTYRGGSIVLYMEAGQVVKVGSHHCNGCVGPTPVTYTIGANASFSIMNLGS